MSRLLNKLNSAVAKLENAATPDVVYTLPDDVVYAMDSDEQHEAIQAALFDNNMSLQAEILLDAVTCSDNSKIHQLFQMVMD